MAARRESISPVRLHLPSDMGELRIWSIDHDTPGAFVRCNDPYVTPLIRKGVCWEGVSGFWLHGDQLSSCTDRLIAASLSRPNRALYVRQLAE